MKYYDYEEDRFFSVSEEELAEIQAEEALEREFSEAFDAGYDYYCERNFGDAAVKEGLLERIKGSKAWTGTKDVASKGIEWVKANPKKTALGGVAAAATGAGATGAYKYVKNRNSFKNKAMRFAKKNKAGLAIGGALTAAGALGLAARKRRDD